MNVVGFGIVLSLMLSTEGCGNTVVPFEKLFPRHKGQKVRRGTDIGACITNSGNTYSRCWFFYRKI